MEKFKMASNNADLPPPFGPIKTVIGESWMCVDRWIM
jgi:hypothetical protein